MAASIYLMGDEELRAELVRLREKFPVASRQSLREEAFAIEKASVRLVPVKTGRLRATHLVSMKGLLDVEATISYGTKYAVYVHEIPARHKVGEDKFLEKPFKKANRGFPGRMVQRIRNKVRVR